MGTIDNNTYKLLKYINKNKLRAPYSKTFVDKFGGLEELAKSLDTINKNKWLRHIDGYGFDGGEYDKYSELTTEAKAYIENRGATEFDRRITRIISYIAVAISVIALLKQ